MHSKLFLVFCAAFSLLAASLCSEQWYRVSETELQKLENISQNSETDRQNWLLQASELKAKVQILQQGSKTLNEKLTKERETTKSLRTSFEQSETEQLKRASDYETEIAGLKEKKGKAELDVQKIKNQRNTLLFILLGALGILTAFVAFRLKRI